MTVKRLAVLLYDRWVADLIETSGGQHVLSYTSETSTPVSLSMPTSLVEHKHRVVEPFLNGLLPDRDDVRSAIGRGFGASGRNPFALLRHIGLDCAGAVQFVPPESVDEVLARRGTLRTLSDAEIGDRIAEVNRDGTRSWVSPSERWSLAGAQAKFALHRRTNGTWAEATGSVPTTHILKPGVASLTAQALNEHLCLSAARKLGISAAQSEYVEFAGYPAIVVERYDRLRDDSGQVRRVHQEDLCQALSVPPDKKYEDDGGPGAKKVLQLLQVWTKESDRFRFVESQVFNYFVGGTDAHAKNLSLLLVGDVARFAPLYDVASGFPYENLSMSLPISVAGERRFGHIDDHHWATFATQAGIHPEAVLSRVDEISRQLPDAITEAYVDTGITGPGPNELVRRIRKGIEEQSAAAHRLRAVTRPATRQPRVKTSPASNTGSFASRVRFEGEASMLDQAGGS